MSQQPAEEWETMSQTQRDEIRDRLHEAVESVSDTVDQSALVVDLRRRFAEGSRSGLAARLAPHGI